MKYLLATILIGLMLPSCAPKDTTREARTVDYIVGVERIRGHDYIITTTERYSGGACVIHAAHCPCLTTTGGKP